MDGEDCAISPFDDTLETPLSSTEQAKVVAFTLLMLPTIVFLVGIIPAILLAVGVFMTRRRNELTYIETAVKSFKYYIYLLVAAAAIAAIFYVIVFIYLVDKAEYADFAGLDRGEAFSLLITSLLFIGIADTYKHLLYKLFWNPVAAHAKWVERNGIFANRPDSTSAKVANKFRIIKRENVKQYSVADELIKW